VANQEQADDCLTPAEAAEQSAFEAKRLDAEKHLKELEAAGWTLEYQQWPHPDDPEMFIYLDPYTADELLSPKLVERIKAGRIANC
jgi:hypothetical protein